MWSQIYEKKIMKKVVYVSTKLLLEKSAKIKKLKIKIMKVFTIFGGFW